MMGYYRNVDEMKRELEYLKKGIKRMYGYHVIYYDDWDERGSIENEIDRIENEIVELEKHIAIAEQKEV